MTGLAAARHLLVRFPAARCRSFSNALRFGTGISTGLPFLGFVFCLRCGFSLIDAARETTGMSHPLDGAWAKFARAEEHFEALGPVWHAFLDSEAYGFTLNRQPESRTIWISFNVLKPIPPRVAIIAGDVVQNLRASLDYVAAELVNAYGGNSMRSQFPIYTDEDSFIGDVREGPASRRKGPLNGIPPTSEEWAFIEGLQPYCRADEAKFDPLFALNFMSNRDKHRGLTPTFGAPLIRDWSKLFQVTGSTGLRFQWKYLWLPWQPLEDSALLGGIEFREAQHVLDVQVDVHSDPPFDVFFDEGVVRSGSTQEYGLTRIFEHVRKIIREAEVFFR